MQRPASRGLGAVGGVQPPMTANRGPAVHRPVTQQGLRGQRTAVPGQRSHGDFTTKASVEIDLRKRIQMLNDEIQKIDHESERINEEAEEVNRLEPQYKQLLDEVRNLEGTLADYNLAFDKMRANTTEQDVQIEVNRTKQRKTVLQNEQDALFRQQQVEKEKVLDLENMLRQDIHHDQLQEIDALVHALDELQMDYEDHKEMLAQLPEVDTTWEKTTARVKQLERDRIRLDELVKLFNIPDPQERHNAIMGYTRQKKSDQTASTQAVNMARANMSRLQKELKEADNPAFVPVTSEVEAEKLHQQYKELQESVDQLQRHGANRDALENEIQQMLVRMSKTLSSVQQLPNADEANDLVDEYITFLKVSNEFSFKT
jgi:intraflagellar transport protein 74